MERANDVYPPLPFYSHNPVHHQDHLLDRSLGCVSCANESGSVSGVCACANLFFFFFLSFFYYGVPKQNSWGSPSPACQPAYLTCFADCIAAYSLARALISKGATIRSVAYTSDSCH